MAMEEPGIYGRGRVPPVSRSRLLSAAGPEAVAQMASLGQVVELKTKDRLIESGKRIR